ncbi:hypothetical protein [Thiohalobacter sp.]|uniref:hypothetical protein n=1 Tax=Thiohalobacter sp. TaxID=2025948 RepID=UPI002623002F|nr:hypothetical protein [Thiohalobacter sp.]
MTPTRHAVSRGVRWCARLLVAPALTVAASAATATTTYDFTSNGPTPTAIGSGFGNALDYGDLTVTAWGTTGVPQNANSLIDEGQIIRYTTGLGACNKSEGTDCGNPQHQIDNVGDDDLVLFAFDGPVRFDSIVIDPYGYWDRDVTFWVADITSTDLVGLSPADLLAGTSVFGSPTNVSNTPGYGPVTINLGGGAGNALLFGGRLDYGNLYDNDRFKIASLSVTPVPLPAALWLFGSGLLGLAGLARRR